MNNKEKIVKRLLFEIIDKMSKDADVYNHNGSLWLINTDSTRWIFEFTKSKTLWYNYNFFKSALKFVSLDVNEGDNQKYITEWFESRYLNINQVKHTLDVSNPNPPGVEETVQNGVKNTNYQIGIEKRIVDDTIQNGVKQTELSKRDFFPEDIFQNGVKHTEPLVQTTPDSVEDTIQNGVKHTEIGWAQDNGVEDAVKNGIKETVGSKSTRSFYLRHAIKNGVKEIKEISDLSLTSEIFKVKCKNTIRDGVKHTQFGGSAQIKSVEDTIKNGIKETKPSTAASWTEVDNTIKDGVKHTFVNADESNDVVEHILQNSVKETHRQKFNLDGLVDDIIDNGVKEVRTDDGYVNHFRQNYKFNNVFEDIIKEVQSDCSNNTERVNGVIKVGEKLN